MNRFAGMVTAVSLIAAGALVDHSLTTSVSRIGRRIEHFFSRLGV